MMKPKRWLFWLWLMLLLYITSPTTLRNDPSATPVMKNAAARARFVVFVHTRADQNNVRYPDMFNS
jgi:hypothetical protein